MGTDLGVKERGSAGNAGFTLIEIVVAVAIIAATTAAGFGITLASRSFAVSAAASEFDHLLDDARTVAHDLGSATIAFAADAYGDGTEIRVLTPDGNGALMGTKLPPVHSRAAIEETDALGKPPFGFVVHAGGALGGRAGYRTGSPLPPETGCPPSGSFHFVIRAAGASADRFVSCRITLASTGPVAFASWPPAPMAPNPTPCGGACPPPVLPTPPSSAPSCPPGYAGNAAGCVPTGPATAPHYHVSTSLAAQAMAVGGNDTLTAQAQLTNPNAVPAGTPSSVPVSASTDAACSAAPPGWQPSGTTFTLMGLAVGTCTITVTADVSGVPSAAADTATATVSVTGSPSATPRPATCDLVTNGKCYHRIVDQTSQTFWKYVAPDTQCGIVNGTGDCWYIDAIRSIDLYPGFAVQPLFPPIDSAHELLLAIDLISGVDKQCLPFSSFSGTPAASGISWGGSSIGAPVNAPPGYGQPSLFMTENHILPSGTTGSTGAKSPWPLTTTLSSMYAAVAFQLVGSPYSFTYSSTQVSAGSTLQWHPDFPGCDAAGDLNSPGVQYGFAGVNIVLEAYQANP